MNTLIRRLLPLLASLLVASAPVQAASVKLLAAEGSPPPGHLEIMLSGSPGADLAVIDLDRFLARLRDPAFLATAGTETPDAVAPCSLLAAAMASASMNRLFAGVINPGSVKMFPPPGTNLLGLYDADIAQAKGGIPRDDPAKAADILARLVVFRSWGSSTDLNSLIAPLNQGACLDLLSEPERFGAMLARLDPADIALTHTKPVSAYIAAFSHEDGKALLAELLRPGYLDTPLAAGANPLAPCSLLKAFRLGARLNESWGRLVKGRFDAAGRPDLAAYGDELGNLSNPAMTPSRRAEVMAAVFASEIMRANDVTGQLTRGATQHECLDEVFTPGKLRLKWLKEGVMIPLR